jgi:hypothetical protein
VMLWRSGIETRGQGLEEIQEALQGQAPSS